MDLGGILVSICALSIVCLGSLTLLAFVVIKLAGRSVSSIVQGMAGGDYVEGLEKRENLAIRRPSLRRDPSSFEERLRGGSGQTSGQSSPLDSEGGIPRTGSPFNRTGRDADMGSLRGRSKGSSRRKDNYEIYDDEGDGGFF